MKSLEIESHSVFTTVSLVVMVSLMTWTWHEVTDNHWLVTVTFPADLQVGWFTDSGVINRWWHKPEMSQTEQKVSDGFFPESDSLMVRDVDFFFFFFSEDRLSGQVIYYPAEVFSCEYNRSSLQVQRQLSCGDKKTKTTQQSIIVLLK